MKYLESTGRLLYVTSGGVDIGLAKDCCCTCPEGCPDVDGGVQSWTLTWDPAHICVAGKLDPNHPLAKGSVTIVNVGDWIIGTEVSPCMWWKTYNNTQNLLYQPGHWACWFSYGSDIYGCWWTMRLWVYAYTTGSWPDTKYWDGFNLPGQIAYFPNQDLTTPKVINTGCLVGYNDWRVMPVTCTPG